MTLSYHLGYLVTILVHPTRRQSFAGKLHSTFRNIWDLVICATSETLSYVGWDEWMDGMVVIGESLCLRLIQNQFFTWRPAFLAHCAGFWFGRVYLWILGDYLSLSWSLRVSFARFYWKINHICTFSLDKWPLQIMGDQQVRTFLFPLVTDITKMETYIKAEQVDEKTPGGFSLNVRIVFTPLFL